MGNPRYETWECGDANWVASPLPIAVGVKTAGVRGPFKTVAEARASAATDPRRAAKGNWKLSAWFTPARAVQEGLRNKPTGLVEAAHDSEGLWYLILDNEQRRFTA